MHWLDLKGKIKNTEVLMKVLMEAQMEMLMEVLMEVLLDVIKVTKFEK